MSTAVTREKLLSDHHEAERAHSTATVLFHAAIANHFGQNLMDWICAGLIQQNGSMTAGQLAEQTGLTTGAITGLIDRLEKAGVVERQADPSDRRRVVVVVKQGWEETLTPFYAEMLEPFSDMLATYTDEELALIIEFMGRNTAVMQQAAAKLRYGSKQSNP